MTRNPTDLFMNECIHTRMIGYGQVGKVVTSLLEGHRFESHQSRSAFPFSSRLLTAATCIVNELIKEIKVNDKAIPWSSGLGTLSFSKQMYGKMAE